MVVDKEEQNLYVLGYCEIYRVTGVSCYETTPPLLWYGFGLGGSYIVLGVVGYVMRWIAFQETEWKNNINHK
jgi:hypothetical protein